MNESRNSNQMNEIWGNLLHSLFSLFERQLHTTHLCVTFNGKALSITVVFVYFIFPILYSSEHMDDDDDDSLERFKDRSSWCSRVAQTQPIDVHIWTRFGKLNERKRKFPSSSALCDVLFFFTFLIHWVFPKHDATHLIESWAWVFILLPEILLRIARLENLNLHLSVNKRRCRNIWTIQRIFQLVFSSRNNQMRLFGTWEEKGERNL